MNLEESVPHTILIETGGRFQCLPDCGFCCGFWDISIDAQRKEHLLQLEWVQAAQLKTITFDDSQPEFRQVTGRYLRYLVRSLLNTGRMPILKRLAIVSANYALVDWLARAHAIELGRTRAELGDLVFGIQIVEKFTRNRRDGTAKSLSYSESAWMTCAP